MVAVLPIGPMWRIAMPGTRVEAAGRWKRLTTPLHQTPKIPDVQILVVRISRASRYKTRARPARQRWDQGFPRDMFVGDFSCSVERSNAADSGGCTLPANISSPVIFFP